MVRAVHDKLYSSRYGAEFADNKLITYKIVMMCDVLLKAFRSVYIVVIAVIAGDNVFARNDVFDIHDLFDVFIRINFIRIRPYHIAPLSQISGITGTVQ